MQTRNQPYEDRDEAGTCLAKELSDLHGAKDTVVLGLCRGGMPVARRVADALELPLDVLVVRKLPAPGNPELAMGAIAENGAEVLNTDVLRWVVDTKSALARAREQQGAELQRRAALYRGDRPSLSLEHKHALIVDDGAATGATARAAIVSARRSGASRVTVALPVAPPETRSELAMEADDLRCPWTPVYFVSVGACYRQFPQVADRQVVEALARRPSPPVRGLQRAR
jgi:putative phosphoribosyl transferase